MHKLTILTNLDGAVEEFTVELSHAQLKAIHRLYPGRNLAEVFFRAAAVEIARRCREQAALAESKVAARSIDE